MKRIVSLILAISMVLSMFTFSFAGESLKDVEGTKYEAAVEALMELKIVEGYPDDTYLPDNVVTRAELAKLLVVAYGLKEAATVAGTVTPFADSSNHWASGYVNVSADYKFVNGYPDGSFQPDGTVTYAEAITMCLRVLGYANEIDSKGTWPTNYIAKAQDLKLMEDIEFDSYNDGAKRGNVALLIWNMLRTPMWEVVGESEGDGLQSNPNRYMLNVKFSDYAYADNVSFEGFSIAEDSKDEVAKVYVDLDCDCQNVEECKHDFLDLGALEYDANDFYTFVEGTEVEVLVNEKDKTLLTMVPTGDNKVVSGSKEAYEKNYEYNTDYVADLSEVAFDEIHARVEKQKAVAYTVLGASSIYVDEIEFDKEDEEILINDEDEDVDGVEYFDYQYSEIVLKDGERTTLNELEVGDVMTTVLVAYNGVDEEDIVGRFHVIATPEKVEGEFVKLATVKFEDREVTYKQLTIDSAKKAVDVNATFVEDPTEDDVIAEELGEGLEEMETEQIVAKLDPVYGKVVRIEFDGEINGDENKETSFEFYGVDSIFGVDSSSKKDYRYVVDLIGDDNDDTEDVKIGKNTAAAALASEYDSENNDTMIGSFIVAELSEEGEIVDIQVIADRNGKGDLTPVVYGDKANEEYVMSYYATASFVEDTTEKSNYISGDEKVKVNDSTILVKVIFDDKGTINDVTDDEYRVEFEEGLKALKKVEKEPVITVVDAINEYETAKYVVIWDDLSDNSGNKVSVLKDSNEEEILVGGGNIELADEDSILEIADNTPDLSDYELFVYKVIERENKNDKFSFVAGLTSGDLSISGEERSNYVYSRQGTEYKLDSGDSEALSLAKFVEDYEDYMVVLVNVTEDKDNKGKYEVKDYKEIANSEIANTFKPVISSGSLKDNAKTVHTRYIIDSEAKVVFIINGMLQKAQ